MLVPDTQFVARERRDDVMSFDGDPRPFPGVPVTQLDSDGFDALRQLLDGLYVVRDDASVRSASQRADVTTFLQ